MIKPAILEKEFTEIQRKIQLFGETAEIVHIDIADGVYVENRTFDQLSKFRELGIKKPLEVHLMVNDPMRYIQTASDAIQTFVVHVECLKNVEIFKIHPEIALAVNHETPWQTVVPHLDKASFVQFMSVNPGKQGGNHITKAAEKIADFKENFPNIRTQVDGGISRENILQYCKINVDGIVIGSKIVNTKDPVKELQEFIELEREYKSGTN